MPRISIIIAHQNDQRLEDTLLSVLENRPRDCEVIVAHDGSYADPYQLADEVLFVETNASTTASKLNEALYAACSPVVHILGEGVQVTDGWCEAPSQRIARQQAVAVTPLIECTDRRATYAGLDGSQLDHRGLLSVKRDRAPNQCAAPMLAAGFYSRRLLLGLGGLLESVDSSVTDVDVALTLSDLELTCEVESQSVVRAASTQVQTPRNAGVMGDLANLLVAHHCHASGMIAGLTGAASRLVSSLLNPSQWAPAVAFGMGLTSNRLENEITERLANWTRSQESQRAAAATAAAPAMQRRAA